MVSQLFDNFFLRRDVTFYAFLRFYPVVFGGVFQTLIYTVEWHITDFSCLDNLNRCFLDRLLLGNDLGWLGRLVCCFLTIICYFGSAQNMFVLITLNKLTRLLGLISSNSFILRLDFRGLWSTNFNVFIC